MKILYLEDNLDDYELLDHVLRRSGMQYSLTNASNQEEYEKLNLSEFDIILSDYNLNGFTGFDALKMAKSRDHNIPFIVISGTVGEEQAVSLLHEGASDFLLKKNVQKLPIVLQKVIKNKRIEEERRTFQKELVNRNVILDSLFHSFEDLVYLKDTSGKYVKINLAFAKFFGLSENSIIGASDEEVMRADFSSKIRESDEYVLDQKKSITYELSIHSDDGMYHVMEMVKSPVIQDGKVTGIVGIARDITARKQLEEKNLRNQHILSQAERLTNSGSFEYDTELDTLTCSPHFLKMMEISGASNVISLKRFMSLIYQDDQRIFSEEFNQAIEDHKACTLDHRFVPVGSKEIKHGRTMISVDLSSGKNGIFHGTIVDSTAEQESNIAMIHIQEKERSSIARELHDNLGQKLSAACLFLDSLATKYPEDPQLLKVKEMTEQSLSEIRSLSSNLSLNIMKQFGLKDSIMQLGHQIPEGIQFDFSSDVHDEEISEFIGTQTFRIIQECINNAMKHSEAQNIEVDLKQDNSLISLKIKDNGKGFKADHGFIGNGLQNMKQRVQRCKGLIHIESEPNKGTLIDVKLPVK